MVDEKKEKCSLKPVMAKTCYRLNFFSYEGNKGLHGKLRGISSSKGVVDL